MCCGEYLYHTNNFDELEESKTRSQDNWNYQKKQNKQTTSTIFCKNLEILNNLIPSFMWIGQYSEDQVLCLGCSHSRQEICTSFSSCQSEGDLLPQISFSIKKLKISCNIIASPNWVKQLQQSLQKSSNLECLEIILDGPNSQNMQFLEQVSQQLSRVNSLTSLKLSIEKCDQLHPDFLSSFSNLVANQKNLKNMSFYLNQASSDTNTVQIISEKILRKANNNLLSIELDLQSCQLGSDEGSSLSETIRSCWQLQQFKLTTRKSSLGKSFLIELLLSLRRCLEIKTLILDLTYDVSIITFPNTHLLTLIQSANRLSTIEVNLKQFSLQFEDLQRLAKSAAENTSLMNISFLLHNKLQTQAFVVLYALYKNEGLIIKDNLTPLKDTFDLSFIQQNHWLSMSFGASELNAKEVEFLALLVSQVKYLDRLELCIPKNYVSNWGLLSLADSLTIDPLELTYLTLDFSDSFIGVKAIQRLSQFISKCVNLISLSFAANKSNVCNNELQELGKMIPTLKQLKILSLSFYNNFELSNSLTLLPLVKSLCTLKYLHSFKFLFSPPKQAGQLIEYLGFITKIKLQIFRLPRLTVLHLPQLQAGDFLDQQQLQQ